MATGEGSTRTSGELGRLTAVGSTMKLSLDVKYMKGEMARVSTNNPPGTLKISSALPPLVAKQSSLGGLSRRRLLATLNENHIVESALLAVIDEKW